LRDKDVCEEIIQETFFSLWNKRENLQITHTLKAYLFTAVKFQTINYMRSEKVKRDYASSYASFTNTTFDNSNEEHIHLSDLSNLIENEVSKLPEKCQQIFRLSRNDHQSIKNIADLMNISHKTVENQLTKALRQLRSSLGQLFSLSIVILAVC
jgi:RNA polymerase sigma-70 factor (family 1)